MLLHEFKQFISFSLASLLHEFKQFISFSLTSLLHEFKYFIYFSLTSTIKEVRLKEIKSFNQTLWKLMSFELTKAGITGLIWLIADMIIGMNFKGPTHFYR